MGRESPSVAAKMKKIVVKNQTLLTYFFSASFQNTDASDNYPIACSTKITVTKSLEA